MRGARPVIKAAKRTLVITVVGIVWFIFSTWLFLWMLPQFGFYNQWITNYGTNVGDVFQFWTLVPEVMLFFFGIFWAGGMFEWIMGHLE